MKMNEVVTEIGALPSKVTEMKRDGYKLANMYACEDSAEYPGCLKILFVRPGDAMMISSPLGGRKFPSLTADNPETSAYEREIFEMNGLLPEHHPDLRMLRIRTETEGWWPLSKHEKNNSPEKRLSIPHNGISGEGVFEIPVGPVHAGIIGPGHFRFSVAGEPMLRVRATLGYSHRGIEKLLETDYSQNNSRLIERIAGDECVANGLAYANALESGKEIPMRAKCIRTICAELERINNHFGDIAGAAQDAAFTVPATFGAGLKEKSMRLNEYLTGNRLLMNLIVPGGVRMDIPDEKFDAIENRVMKMKYDLDELMEMLLDTPSYMDRVETTGRLTTDDAMKVGAVGPSARASGLTTDARKDNPYEMYGSLKMKLVTKTGGDVLSRISVKAGEITESVSLILQCLSKMEPGTICEKELDYGDGCYCGIVEAPRGELVHCINVVNGKIWRYKVRDPSFCNWQALECALPGNIVPDFPLINKSFSLSYSGNDL